MLSQSSLNHVRPFALMALLAGLVVALLAVSTAIALRPAAGSSEEPFTIGTDRGWNAVAERYSGLAGDFTQLRAHQAEAARWSGLAHAYGYDADRAWNAMAERYAGVARLLGGNPATATRSQAAEAARWTGLAHAHGYDSDRAWNAMAERYAGVARLLGGNPATAARSQAAQAARWTGLAQAYMQPGK